MDSSLIEELLNEDESATLDFKRDQYPFSGASNDDKSELIKDILAFANAWRRTDAYILNGVNEVQGGRSTVIGVSNHLDEASLQQLVNSKTNRPATFSYEVYSVDGKQVGVIRIPVQERPIYLLKDFGKLKGDAVYIRRGTSTDTTGPDEIAQMGAEVIERGKVPILDLQFANVGEHKKLGCHATLMSEVLVLPDQIEIPEIPRGSGSAPVPLNTNYYLDFRNYLRLTKALRPLGFVITNPGTVLATGVRIEIVKPKEKKFLLADAVSYPTRPTLWELRSMITQDIDIPVENPVTISFRGNNVEIGAEFGSIQPKARSWSGIFHVGAMDDCSSSFEALIYADNLPEPLRVPLTLSIQAWDKVVTLEELKSQADQYR